MIRELGQQRLTAHAWSASGTPGPVHLRIGPHSFVLDREDAAALSEQLVEALGQLRAEQ